LVTDMVRRTIFANPDRHVQVLAEQFFPRRGGPTAEEIATLTGDAARGQTAFYASCASCHVVGGVGADVGPDLSHAGRKFNRAALLDAIVGPSESIAHGYESNVVTTR